MSVFNSSIKPCQKDDVEDLPSFGLPIFPEWNDIRNDGKCKSVALSTSPGREVKSNIFILGGLSGLSLLIQNASILYCDSYNLSGLDVTTYST